MKSNRSRFLLGLGALGVLGAASSCAHDGAPASASKRRGSGYDVIVVGSGAGGGPLAARLAEHGKRVLLVEAGSDVGAGALYQVPAMHALATEDAAAAWWYFVHHSADPAVEHEDSKWTDAEDGVLYPRGSALGGSTALNALVTVLPSRTDWDRIAAATGDASWRADRMTPYYDRVREWLSVEVPEPGLVLGDAMVSNYLTAAALVAGGNVQDNGVLTDAPSAAASLGSLLRQDVNEELRHGEVTGLYRLPLATAAGHRNGTRERILAVAAATPNLTVMTDTFATRVLFGAEGRARGIEVVHASAVYGASLQRETAPDEREELLAAEEVVLSAGAFNTPQLLMLSGVGTQGALTALGLDVQIDLGGVGRNLQDRYEAPVVTELDEPLAIVAPCELGEGDPDDPCLREWEEGRGVYQTPGFLASVLTRSSADVPLADLQIFAVPTDARGYYPGYAAASARVKNRFSWLLLKAHTQNRDGSVELVDGSPFTRPRIDFRSYDEADPSADPDLRALVAGVKMVRRIETEMRRLTPKSALREVLPGPEVASDDQLATWIRKESWGHHACCTSKLGTKDDPDSVVDSRFRVHGASHLRVVDASVFPEIPGTFLALPTFMIAERAADVILEDDP